MPDHIRSAVLIADPEAYLNELFQMHPDARHDPESGHIQIKNEMIDSSFRYSLLEPGLFLFAFGSFSPIDATYEFLPNPGADYFTLVFYYTDEKTKKPLYFKMEDTFFTGEQFSLFFNGNMNAEIFIKAKLRSSGLRLEIHKDWIKRNLQTQLFENDSVLNRILNFEEKAYLQSNCRPYEHLVKNILSVLSAGGSPFQKLQLKVQAQSLLMQYWSDLQLPEADPLMPKMDMGDAELVRALNYLEGNTASDFPGNGYLAGLCHLSESSFNKKFSMSFRQSPTSYFKEIKMKKALQLLQLGKTVKEVADKVGYKDTSAFGRAFKQHFGKSPALYVKK